MNILVTSPSGKMYDYTASHVALVVKNLLAYTGDERDEGPIPGEGHGKPFSILSWRIPWTEEPGRLWSIGLQRIVMTEVT